MNQSLRSLQFDQQPEVREVAFRERLTDTQIGNHFSLPEKRIRTTAIRLPSGNGKGASRGTRLAARRVGKTPGFMGAAYAAAFANR